MVGECEVGLSKQDLLELVFAPFIGWERLRRLVIDGDCILSRPAPTAPEDPAGAGGNRHSSKKGRGREEKAVSGKPPAIFGRSCHTRCLRAERGERQTQPGTVPSGGDGDGTEGGSPVPHQEKATLADELL